MNLPAALLLIGTLSASAFASEIAPPSNLLGCWGNSTAETRFSDGVVHRAFSECTRFYSEAEISAACVGPNPGQISHLVLSYKMESDSTYSQQPRQGTHLAWSVGYLRPNEFAIDGDSLSVNSYPDATGRTGRSITQLNVQFHRLSDVYVPSQCVPTIRRP
jgi:hypothetical protein